MSTRPNRYPLHDTSDVNSASLPTLFSLQGFPALSVADNTATNALLQSSGAWAGYNDQTLLRCDDLHNSSTAYRISALGLSYATGAGLTDMVPSVLTGVYVIRGNVYHFDAPFTLDAGLNPITFTASMRTWIYCDAAGAVRISIVALATAAAPVGTEFAVIAVDTDATDITAIVTSSSPAHELHFTGANVVVDTSFAVLGDIVLVGNVSIGGTLDVTGAVTLGPAGLDMNSGSITNAIGITCETLVASSTATAISATSSTPAAAAVAIVNSSTGNALTGTSVGNLPTISGTNMGGGPGILGTGGTASAGVEGVATVAAQPGVEGTGAAAAGSHGVSGVAVNTASYGVNGSSSAAATTSGAGVRADGLGDAPALWASANDGHAGLFTSDVSSPKRAAIRITPQDADPTTTGVGDILVNSSLLNKIRHHDGTKYLSVHSSVNGQVSAFANGSAGTTLNSGDLATVTIVAEQAGDVLITATGLIEQAGDGDSCNILLRDATLGTTLQTTVERQIDTDAAGVRTRSFVARFVYTLPAGGSRSFAFRIDGNGGISVTRSACVLSVIGVQ